MVKNNTQHTSKKEQNKAINVFKYIETRSREFPQKKEHYNLNREKVKQFINEIDTKALYEKLKKHFNIKDKAFKFQEHYNYQDYRIVFFADIPKKEYEDFSEFGENFTIISFLPMVRIDRDTEQLEYNTMIELTWTNKENRTKRESRLELIANYRKVNDLYKWNFIKCHNTKI